MKKTITTLFFVLFSVILFSQTLHSPGEILKIMEKSPVMFNVEMLSTPVPCTDRSDNLNYNDVYRVVTDSSMKTYAYSMKPEAEPLHVTFVSVKVQGHGMVITHLKLIGEIQ